MNVLLFFLSVLIAGAVTGLTYVLSSHWIFAAVAGLIAFWVIEGVFERSFGYQPAQHRVGRDNLPAH